MAGEGFDKTEHRYLKVVFSDANAFAVRLSLIAAHRAAYFAQGDLERYKTPYQDTYDTEYNYVLSDDNGYEAEDWAKDNMDWPDLAPYAIPLTPGIAPRQSYTDEWPNPEDVEVVTYTNEDVRQMAGLNGTPSLLLPDEQARVNQLVEMPD